MRPRRTILESSQTIPILLALLVIAGPHASSAGITYVKEDSWHTSLMASITASKLHNSKESAIDPSCIDTTFWMTLHTDFEDNGSIILAHRDWLRQDKLALASLPAQFAQKTREHLLHIEESLVYVEKAGANTAQHRKQLKELAAKTETPSNVDWSELYFETKLLRRRVIFSHPSLDFDKILINVNPPTRYSHNGDQFLGRHSRIGRGLVVLSNWKSGSPTVNTILKGKLPAGAYRSPDLNYEADRILFAFCDHSQEQKNLRRYWLYEAALDGSMVRQLTGTEHDALDTWDDRVTVLIEDNDPCYLPDGGVMFLSTRSQSFGRCHGSRYNPAWVLHRGDKNGLGIVQLSYGNENEVEPAVLNDGRIAFTRWEYTDRHEMFFHKLWTCRPDGSGIAHLFGNDMIRPHQFLEVSAIPGSHKLVATAQGHHSYNTGTIVVIDPNIADNGEEAITHITPETPYSETSGWPNPHYSHPYPVTEDLFLASRANHRVTRQGTLPPAADRGIYLVDPTGGRELIYEDPTMASFSPIAIRKRIRPTSIAPTVSHAADAPSFGTIFLQNAYLTRNDPEGKIKPGMIKALRINALGVQPRASKQGVSRFAKNNIPKKVLGTVPVDEDGTAFFKAPAGVSLQVQTLDENGMAILTERSFFYLQPGENRSCIGCHEPYGTAPQLSSFAKTRNEPNNLTPPAGPQYEGGMSFIRTVQPVLDRYCISCHGLGKSDNDKAKSLNLINEGKPGYSSAYTTLALLGDPSAGNKRDMGGLDKNISRPRDFYAYRNKLPHMLLKNHGGCKLDQDSFMRVVEWLDTNSPYYGDLFPNKLESRELRNRNSAEGKAFLAFVEARFGKEVAGQPMGALINRVQVNESRILMAPLSKKAGGWGQLKPEWQGESGPHYKKMKSLVERCILKTDNENTNGWKPSLNQGGGEPWVMQAREAYKDSLKQKSKVAQ